MLFSKKIGFPTTVLDCRDSHADCEGPRPSLYVRSGEPGQLEVASDCTFCKIPCSTDAHGLCWQMRSAVKAVAELFPTAIISGRGREKVEEFVKLNELFYAGSHGMDIVGPLVRCRCHLDPFKLWQKRCPYCNSKQTHLRCSWLTAMGTPWHSSQLQNLSRSWTVFMRAFWRGDSPSYNLPSGNRAQPSAMLKIV